MKLKYVSYKTEKLITTINDKIVETTTHKLFRISNNEEIIEFTAFASHLQQDTSGRGRTLSANTINSYREAVIKFIDYLHAAGIMGATGQVDLSYCRKCVMGYVDYIHREERLSISHHVAVIRELMKDYRPRLTGNSINLHINAVEKYITLSERYASALHTKMCREIGISPVENSYQPIFEQVWQSNEISLSQKKFWQQNTMIGGVLGIKNIHAKQHRIFDRVAVEDSKVRNKVEISQQQIEELLNLDSLSLRDRVLYALMFASGLRISEAILLQLCHINFTEHRIFMPQDSISKRGLSDEECRICSAWKGRHTLNDEVLLFGIAEDIFWRELNHYIKNQVTDYSHDFLFTFTKGPRVGRPLLLTLRADEKRSHSNLVKHFKSKLLEIGIPEKSVSGPHFCRHAQVHYLHNEAPRRIIAPDGNERLVFGYPLEVVKSLIGHVNLTSTMNYERDVTEKAKMEHRNAREMLAMNLNEEKLNMQRIKNYHLAEARKIEHALTKLENK
ncbi:tyrosine-type recombinase/integrase [Vibrio viridaestus]|uniref:Tyr recombinase domain-containing protein n=1 Tax=Vibrio viridaestus TaxID=2487322 RepID=A0A3N9TD11_9VIBR|nr:tyrosine-type recombinase/integrase [Vibrio viridaestus]RQW62078.1 hypothetical protein EES38_15265 [Vibrio viridaestus]